ncbi:hypothetical protein [Myceligenerans salitolerans]|uniref:Uncharacterized protein n=1 Tax=Myceligenerans salitolerans TaxID=1230528 RepID=A0ABS3I341_9MICO|nr:hypothetical protein [Myceligenerans salitolerans]MBO0607413.1 hypothetical protein [Myceligenerans salitolerans]
MAALPALVGRETSVDIVDEGTEGTDSSPELLQALVSALPWWPENTELGIAFQETYLTLVALQGRVVVRTRYPAVLTESIVEPLDPTQMGWRAVGDRNIQLIGSTMTEVEFGNFLKILDLTVRQSLGEHRLTGFIYSVRQPALRS